MLTRLIVKHFKKLENLDIQLSDHVVFIGPNNSGKTSALQALTLWEIGLKTWLVKRGARTKDSKRTGVAINRKELIALSVPNALHLWNDLVVREYKNKKTENRLIQIQVEGITDDTPWQCGLEFDFANSESFYCRPLRLDDKGVDRMDLPLESLVETIKVAFLPPMSGLTSIEPKLEPGRINVLIGEGQTAQILRNICYSMCQDLNKWSILQEKIKALFDVELNEPLYNPARGDITMSYKEKNGVDLDISSSGRGFQQTLLIIAFLLANPNTVVLLDEPDAHLEILRQRQIYQTITDIARSQSSQLINATHSEIVLQEAAEKDTVIAFTGAPHQINDKGQQIRKALKDIGFEHYYLAEEKKWVLYLEGSTDLSVLQAFASILGHAATEFLKCPFLYVMGANQPSIAAAHFYALKDAFPKLKAIAIFDRIDNQLQSTEHFVQIQWRKREIENYMCTKDILFSFAESLDKPQDDRKSHSVTAVDVMRSCIAKLEEAAKTYKKNLPFSDDIKASDDFLEPLFVNFFEALGRPVGSFGKKDYFRLAAFMTLDQIDPEIVEKLDMIVAVAKST